MFRKINISPESKTSEHFSFPDYFDLFQDRLTEEKIRNLYVILKQFEIKGYVSYKKYLISMKYIFDSDSNQNENLDYNNIHSEKSSNSSESDSNSISNNNNRIFSCYL